MLSERYWGYDKIGIYRPSTGQWFLDTNGDGIFDAGDSTFYFGGPTSSGGSMFDLPVAGNWNGASNGRDQVGIYRPSTGQWFLDYSGQESFNTAFSFSLGGITGDLPVAGAWNPSIRATDVGVFRYGYYWLLDYAEDYAFGAGDLAFPYGGIAGDIPVVGAWNQEFNVAPSMPNTLSVNNAPCSSGSCGSAPAGTQNLSFVFTYNDPMNGSNDVSAGQAWFADAAGVGHCNLLWGSGIVPNSNYLTLVSEDGLSSQSTSSWNYQLSNTFCTVSVAQPQDTSATALTVTLTITLFGNAGTYSVVSQVTDLDGDTSPPGTLGTWTITQAPITASVPTVHIPSGSTTGSTTLTITTGAGVSGSPVLAVSNYPSGVSVSNPGISVSANSTETVEVQVVVPVGLPPSTYDGWWTIGIYDGIDDWLTTIPVIFSIDPQASIGRVGGGPFYPGNSYSVTIGGLSFDQFTGTVSVDSGSFSVSTWSPGIITGTLTIPQNDTNTSIQFQVLPVDSLPSNPYPVTLGCGDIRNTMIYEYWANPVITYHPPCTDFTQASPSSNFLFYGTGQCPQNQNGLNSSRESPSAQCSTQYPWAILTNNLGSGIDAVYGIKPHPMQITSGYRNPGYQAAVTNGQWPNDPHTHGTAVDIATNSSMTTWTDWKTAVLAYRTSSGNANPCIEPAGYGNNTPTYNHIHLDWRGTCPAGWRGDLDYEEIRIRRSFDRSECRRLGGPD